MIFRKLLFPSIILFFLVTPNAHSQLLNDDKALKSIQLTLDKIYNFEFSEAQLMIKQIEAHYPGHPVSHILDSFILFWKYLPVKNNPSKSKEYVQNLNQCLVSVNKMFGSNSKDPEAVFYTMVARGYLAMMYNYNGELLSAAGEGKKAYSAFLEGMKLTNKNPEFYFTSGMYNYYVETYPEMHPMVKPLLLFFKNGDKSLGLKQIEIGTQQGVITRAEACFYLTHLYLKYENKPDKAVVFMQKLVNLYPQNPLYVMKYIETQILATNYTAAASKMPLLKKANQVFFPAAYQTFLALLSEKMDKNDKVAEQYYHLALKLPHDSQYSREYTAMTYAGLARIAARGGDKSKAKLYYKKCLETAEYKGLLAEANAFK